MPWSSKVKDISTTSTHAHPLTRVGVAGRAPGVSTIDFTPIEFFGAAARCSHLHVINPAIVTLESLVVSALVEQHVDDVSSDFAVLSSADNFKDFVKSYFAGSVAAGIAYLQMIRDGYVWSDHFENLGGGASGVTRTPDFVFSRPGDPTVALVESKGTRSAAATKFDATVTDGYLHQVEPHLGNPVGGSTASHGFCVGGRLTSTTKAELNVHHTAALSGGAGAPLAGPTSGTIRRNSYATTFRLVHGEQLAQQVRRGIIESPRIPFLEFGWIGLRFLTLFGVHPFASAITPWPEDVRPRSVRSPFDLLPPPFGFVGFALERNMASEVLRALSGAAEQQPETFDLEPVSRELGARAREDGGALFPDGFAVVSGRCGINGARLVVWNRSSRAFGAP